MTVTVVAGAQALESLAPGALIEVAMRLRARSFVEVTSERGPLTLQLPRDAIPLPGGARLVLQMLQSGGEPTFRIISLNGRPILPGGIPLLPGAPATPAQGGTLPGAQPVPAPGSAAPSASGISASGPIATGPSAPMGITATVLRPMMPPGSAGAQPNAASGGLPLDLAPGTKVVVRIAGTAPPQAANPPAPAAPNVPAGGSTPAVGSALTAQGGTAAPSPQAPQTATQPPVPAAAPPAATSTLAGTVTAHPPGGQAVVHTPAGTLAVSVPPEVSVGARVLLDVVGPPLPPASTGPANAPQGLSTAGWPALAATLDTLARADPKLAEQLMNSMPQANARLGLTLSVMAVAIRSGDWRQLVSDPIRNALDRVGRGELAARLKGDVEKLSADATRPLSGGSGGGTGEWRAMALPFLNGGAIEPIRLYMRRPPEDEDGTGRRRGGGDGQRFVIEITMSHMGRVQFDGMVRRDDKQFDLILRTETPLPTEMRRDIMLIFTGAGELCGTKGVVVFQPGRFIDLPAIETAPTALMA